MAVLLASRPGKLSAVADQLQDHWHSSTAVIATQSSPNKAVPPCSTASSPPALPHLTTATRVDVEMSKISRVPSLVPTTAWRLPGANRAHRP